MAKPRDRIAVIRDFSSRRRIALFVATATIADIIKPIITRKPSTSNVRDIIAFRKIIISGGIPAIKRA